MTAPQLPANTNVAGKYTVLTCLGAGGSSATYHAVAADGREVALKIFDPSIRQRADIMSALEQTYAATNALSADVVVPLLDAGYDPTTGAPFSVTERIPFPSLAQILSQRPLTPEELGSVLGFVARALDAAHSRQLYHHALKPTNIFVGFAQGYGVRVTDFGAGLARAAVPTQEGYTLAAPWLAPEQVQGSTPAAGGADVFAMALVAFSALTGRSYWRSCQSTPDLASWQQELMAQRVPTSARARELGVTLSSVYDPILGAALSVDPGQRYRSIGELAGALDSLMSAKGFESPAATMAFPNVNVPLPGGPGDYPPPPPPLGGMPGAPPGYPGGAYPGQGAGGPADAGLGAAPGPGTGSFAPQGQPGFQGENGKKPTLELSGARRPASTKLVPILVGVVGLLLIGVVAAAWVLIGHKPSADGSADAGAEATSASAVRETPPPSAEPSVPASAAPEAPPPAEPSAEPSAEVSAPPSEAQVTITCDPECEELKIDGKPVSNEGKPIPLPPGKHVIVGSKAGYTSASETIAVVAGKPLEKQLKLTAKPSVPSPATVSVPGPGPGPGPGLKPKCGKFIKTNCTK